MKNQFNLLVVLSLIIITNKVAAQKFKPGLIGGVVAADVVGIDSDGKHFHKAGMTFGGLVSTKLSETNSVQFEILYTQKGNSRPPDSINNYNYYILSLNYVEIPLIFKHQLKFSIKQKTVDRFYLEAGPSYGKLISFKENINGNIYKNGNYRKDEIALNIGFGSAIGKRLYFNIRGSNGLISVIKNNKTLNSFIWYTYNKGNNAWLSFTLRYIFDNEKTEAPKPTAQ